MQLMGEYGGLAVANATAHTDTLRNREKFRRPSRLLLKQANLIH